MKKDEITQLIRIADVVIVMPVLLIAASNKKLDPSLRLALGIIGIGTGIYNGINWYTHRK